MTAPVIFFMFLNSFAPLVISDNFLTTLIFDEEVVRPHSGATKSELYIQKSPDSKMLFIKSNGKKIKTNLTVPTKSGKLYSFLILRGERPHSIVQIKDGKKEQVSRDIKKVEGLLIQEGNTISKIENNSRSKKRVNFTWVEVGSYLELPKGAPIFIGDKRVYR